MLWRYWQSWHLKSNKLSKERLSLCGKYYGPSQKNALHWTRGICKTGKVYKELNIKDNEIHMLLLMKCSFYHWSTCRGISDMLRRFDRGDCRKIGEYQYYVMMSHKSFNAVPNWSHLNGKNCHIVSGRKPASWQCRHNDHLSGVWSKKERGMQNTQSHSPLQPNETNKTSNNKDQEMVWL